MTERFETKRKILKTLPRDRIIFFKRTNTQIKLLPLFHSYWKGTGLLMFTNDVSTDFITACTFDFRFTFHKHENIFLQQIMFIFSSSRFHSSE